MKHTDTLSFYVGERRISPVDPCFVIAEVGVNHNGDVALAERLIDHAAQAGADAVKFQTFRTDLLVAGHAGKAEYQKQQTGPGNQAEMLRGLELSIADFRRLQERCRARSVEFISTAFDSTSLDEVIGLGVRILKWPSGEINNLPLLRQAAQSGLPIILSTGMANLEEVAIAVRALDDAGSGPVALLQCISQYPAPLEAQNLRCIATLAATFGRIAGFSDHTDGMLAAIAARGLGMAILEKHITLDRGMLGPDHAASLEPDAFADMVATLRQVEAALGDGRKRVHDCERSTRLVARKSLVYARDLPTGHRLLERDLAAKRPGSGIAPGQLDDLVGRFLKHPVTADSLAEWRDVR